MRKIATLVCLVAFTGACAAGEQTAVPAPAPSGAEKPGAEKPAAQPVAAVDWDRAVATVRVELAKRDLLDWSDELAAKLDAADGEGLVVAIEVFRRSGRPDRVSQAIARLAKLPDAGRPPYEVVDGLLRVEYYEQARLFFDALKRDALDSTRMTGFLDWLTRTRGEPGVEDYLRGKYLQQRETPEAGGRRGWGHNWSHLYWRHLQSRGKLAGLVGDLAEKIKQSPTKTELVFEYLSAVSVLPADTRPATAWLAETTRFASPLDNFLLAGRFRWDRKPDAVIVLLERSLAQPVTDDDRTRFNSDGYWQIYVPPKDVEALLRQWTKAQLAEAYLQAGKPDRAQPLVEELTGSKDGTLKDLAPYLLAGRTQDASGMRVVEKRIKAAEEEKKDSVRYWLNRADYYKGRKEWAQVDEAYRAAMKLPADKDHWEVVRDYGWFLSSLGRAEEAAWLYRDEIARVAPDGEVDFWLIQLMSLDGKGGVRVGWDEPLLWEWLAGQKKKNFGDSAQSHLWRAYLGASNAGAWKAFEAKARALAAEPCPAPLQYYFGYLLHHHGETAEGLKMMVAAWDRWGTNDYPFAYNVGPEVLGYLLAARDEKTAQRVLDRVLKDPVNGQDTRWLGEFAVRAADAGFREMAMRLWRARSALDLSDQRDLEKLASKGMADSLRDFYAGLAKRAPGNEAITSALKKVGK